MDTDRRRIILVVVLAAAAVGAAAFGGLRWMDTRETATVLAATRAHAEELRASVEDRLARAAVAPAVFPPGIDETGFTLWKNVARMSEVRILERIEGHAESVGIKCDKVDVVQVEGSSRVTYEVRGRGEPMAIARFLAVLEGDSGLSILREMRIWVEMDIGVSYGVDVAVYPDTVGS